MFFLLLLTLATSLPLQADVPPPPGTHLSTPMALLEPVGPLESHRFFLRVTDGWKGDRPPLLTELLPREPVPINTGGYKIPRVGLFAVPAASLAPGGFDATTFGSLPGAQGTTVSLSTVIIEEAATPDRAVLSTYRVSLEGGKLAVQVLAPVLHPSGKPLAAARAPPKSEGQLVLQILAGLVLSVVVAWGLGRTQGRKGIAPAVKSDR